MMFGVCGTKDQDESIRLIHRALEAAITFVDPGDVYSAGESDGAGPREEAEVCLRFHPRSGRWGAALRASGTPSRAEDLGGQVRLLIAATIHTGTTGTNAS
jgi:hypothetical protein